MPPVPDPVWQTYLMIRNENCRTVHKIAERVPFAEKVSGTLNHSSSFQLSAKNGPSSSIWQNGFAVINLSLFTNLKYFVKNYDQVLTETDRLRSRMKLLFWIDCELTLKSELGKQDPWMSSIHTRSYTCFFFQQLNPTKNSKKNLNECFQFCPGVPSKQGLKCQTCRTCHKGKKDRDGWHLTKASAR